ncbi:MAG: flagellar hook-basal body protein, partial [bacterium]
YTSASGLNAEVMEQDVVANNIANVNTIGFKKDTPVLESFPTRLLERIQDRLDKTQTPVPPDMPAGLYPDRYTPALGFMGSGVRTAETATDFTAGPLTRTNQPLDMAIEGNALFVVQKGDGSMAYTRSGNFTVNSDKELCTVDGNVVMGRDTQPITINGMNVVVDTGGAVKVDGRLVGTLQLVHYDPGTFMKSGDSLYTKHEDLIEAMVPETPPRGVRVLQGYVEQSNVQVVTEMVRMITLMRAYEENTKSITMQDETLSQLISSVGTPSA